MKTSRDEYDQLTDSRREPKDDRCAEEIINELNDKRDRGVPPTANDFDMLVTLANYWVRNATSAQLSEAGDLMKAGLGE